MRTPEGNGRRWLADLVFAATQQTGVAATVATVWLLADRVGPDRAILVGLLVGLATALVAATVRSAVNPSPPSPPPPPPPPPAA